MPSADSSSSGIPGFLPVRTIGHPGWIESQVTIQGPVDEVRLRCALEELPEGGAPQSLRSQTVEAASCRLGLSGKRQDAASTNFPDQPRSPGDRNDWGGAETVIGVDLFGTHEQVSRMEKLVRRAGIAAPVTSILSTSPLGGGMQIAAAAGVERTPLFFEGEIAGYLLEDPEARYCILGGLKPRDAQSSREQQTGEVFAAIEKTLAHVGMGFEHVVRTWFYNEKILEWYSSFNRVRTGYFSRQAIRRMPASTGIGAPNPVRTALVAKAVAVCPATDGARIRTVNSPLQCDAFAYGSAFSRALEVADSRSRTLYISGTASIEPGGKSVHIEDPAGQIELTMDVVRGILDEAGMKIEETTRALAYFRNPAHLPLWKDYCRRHRLPPLPLLAVGSDVCREDLLFEIEFDVSQPRIRA